MIEYSNSAAPRTISPLETMWSLRPLLPLSILAIGGCALGFWLARAWNFEILHAIPTLLWTISLTLAHVFFLAKIRFETRFPSLCALVLLVLWALFAARRVFPAPDDIAQIVQRAPEISRPQRKIETQIRGIIADAPRRSDFGLEFPLQINRVLDTPQSSAQMPKTTQFANITKNADAPQNWRETRGRVWVRLALPSRDARILASQMPREGDEITVFAKLADLPRAGNDGERENRARFLAANCWCLAQSKFIACKITRRAAANSLSARVGAVRRAVSAYYSDAFAKLKKPYPQALSQLLVAMVFGENGLEEPLPRATRDRFRAAGMSHILVASGTQVAFLAVILLSGARLVGLRRVGIFVLVLPILLFYALLTGGAASIWRATLAGACVAWALLLGRDADGLSLWSLAVVVLLGIDPMQALDLSFQLTFAATWGLLVVSPPLKEFLQRALRTKNAAENSWFDERVLEATSLTISAQIATTPLLLYHFGRISFIALGANFMAIPVAGMLVGTGVAGLFLPINSFNFALVNAADKLATLASSAPGAQSQAPPLPLFWTLGAYAILLTALFGARFSSTRFDGTQQEIFMKKWRTFWRIRRQNTRVQGVLATLFLLLSMAMLWRIFQVKPNQLRVTLLDVGQGESIVIQTPNGKTVLIDGGTSGTSGNEGRGEVGRAVIVPFLQASGIAKIDAMILTHADADHCSALPEVIREIPVGFALDGAAFYAENNRTSSTRNAEQVPEYEATKAAWRARKAPVRAAQSGQKIDLGDGVILTVLAPTSPVLDGDNDNGAVLRLDYGKTSFLFAADIEESAESRLLQRGENLRCTVLKVAHHGSKTSSTRAFLQAANPSLAVISCGRYNSFGHPAPQTLQALSSQKIPMLRTDISGSISVSCDGRECWAQPFR